MAGSKKRRQDAEEALLTELSKSNAPKMPPSSWLLFLAAAAVTVSSPIIIYSTPLFDMSLSNSLMQISCFVVLNTVLLANVYVAVVKKKRSKLFGSRELMITKGLSANEITKLEANLRASTTDECRFYALGVVNIFFMILFFFCSFYVLPGFAISPSTGFILSLTISSVMLLSISNLLVL
jgi:hypothetical protein